MDFVDVELYLRSRLVPAHEGDSALAGAVAAGLVETVELAGPEPAPVTADDLRGWGVTAPDAYRAARANVRSSAPLHRAELYPDGAPVTVLYGDGAHTATHVLWLGELLRLPAAGALVTLPHAHAIAVHPLHDRTAVRRAVGGLLRYTRHQYETQPAPLSNQLYWWHGGELTHQPVVHTGRAITVAPTPGLAAALTEPRK